MLLAHMVGDYVLQWTRWRAGKAQRSRRGPPRLDRAGGDPVVRPLIVDPGWWPWAFLIGLTHVAIDASWVGFNRRFASRGMYGLLRLLIDQMLHLGVIVGAVMASGYVTPQGLPGAIAAEVQTHRMWAIALGYVLISMPAWIFIEFVFYGLINGSAPDFSRIGKYKYVGSLERGLIATFVATGQFILVPVVALPRLVLESPQYFGDNRTTLYIAEWLASLAVAVLFGLALGRM
jgi:hypothetical protein